MKKLLILTFGMIFPGLLMVVGFFWYDAGPGGDGIVGEITVENRRYAVTQKWSLEGYKVGFVYELEDRTWGWCYINHQGTRWSSAQLAHDAERET
ncbi:MAG: hypothetical protein AAF514_06325 [Verrucomicrobiota bacterium]